MKGVVKWFNDSKGYGFIDSPECDEIIFAHYRAITGDGFKTLSEGQEVEFEILDKGPKGIEAVNIVKGPIPPAIDPIDD